MMDTNGITHITSLKPIKNNYDFFFFFFIIFQ